MNSCKTAKVCMPMPVNPLWLYGVRYYSQYPSHVRIVQNIVDRATDKSTPEIYAACRWLIQVDFYQKAGVID